MRRDEPPHKDDAAQERLSRPCAICGKPMTHEFRPFCSRRCADIDLHRWLSGRYVIPGKLEDDEDARGDRNIDAEIDAKNNDFLSQD